MVGPALDRSVKIEGQLGEVGVVDHSVDGVRSGALDAAEESSATLEVLPTVNSWIASES
jgi:hypothetical protein